MMKKKLITIVAVGCFALLTAAYTFFSTETNQANSLMLENIEALAQSEINPDCPNGCLTESGYCFCFRPYPKKEAYSYWDK